MSPAIAFHNTAQDWVLAFGLTAVVFAAAMAVRRVASRRLSIVAGRSVNGWDDLLVESIDRLHGVFLFAAAAYIGSLKLTLPDPVRTIIGQAAVILLLVQIAVISSHAVNFWVDRFRRRKMAGDAGALTTLISVSFVLHLVIWIILLLIGLDNLGVNITALVAGLGITGIAVALAIQNILSDLFASFSIILDKPFVIGDFIAVDGFMGKIEHIGLKTTRIRSLSGEQLIFANTDLLKSRIRNYQRMNERRVVFFLRVVSQTSSENLRKIPEMVRQAVERNAQSRFERAHFAEYDSHALKFEIVYWIVNPDYHRFMDIQQAINLELHERFSEAGIELA